jgi:hypothetical protein
MPVLMRSTVEYRPLPRPCRESFQSSQVVDVFGIAMSGVSGYCRESIVNPEIAWALRAARP